MTALATVLQFEPSAQPGDCPDPESDIGFFTMSPASAERVTIQISSVLDRAWEFVALAYKGRAHVALGFPSWDD